MRWLRKLLGIRTPEEAFLARLGIDPNYLDRKEVCDGITFRRISLSEMEGKIPVRDPRIAAEEITILLSGTDQVSRAHRELIHRIRECFPALFEKAVDAILGVVPADERDFRAHAMEPLIMIGGDGEDFDGRSWSMVFSWGAGDFGYHVEFDEIEFVEVWGGD